MGKVRILFTQLFILIFVFGLHAQIFQQFSDNSDQFLNELNSLFSKERVKENKVESEKMMESLVENWNTGIFTGELKENIKGICNLMLKRRL